MVDYNMNKWINSIRKIHVYDHYTMYYKKTKYKTKKMQQGIF